MDHLTKAHILITGGGAPGAAGIIQALSPKYRISSCDQHEKVVGRELADDFFTVPHGSDSHYIHEVQRQVKDRKIDLIIPITTAELIPLSKAKNDLNHQGTRVVVSETSALEIANDKGKLYNHLKEHGVDVPSYRIVHDLNSFDQALDALEVDEKPVIFKPCVANGSRGFRIIDQNVDAHELWLKHKPNNSYISRQESLNLLSKGHFVPLLVSDYLEGDEYSVDCMVVNGKAEMIIPRKRLKINNGISVEGLIEQKTDVIAYCEKVLSTLALEGPIGIQVKYSGSKPYILEINPRLQGTSIAAMGAGVNLPMLTAQWGLGESIDWHAQRDGIKWGTHFYRIYQEVYSA